MRDKFSAMKKMHIVALVLIAVAIATLISFMGDVTSYDTIASAKNKPGKHVNLVAELDKSKPLIYDPVKDPNYLKFTAIDTLRNSIDVVYHNSIPTDMQKSERLVLKGYVENGTFECKEILLKCPSKYKDDMNETEKNINSGNGYGNDKNNTAAETKKP